MWRKLLTLLIVLALAATACGNSTAEDSDSVSGDESETASTNSDTDSQEGEDVDTAEGTDSEDDDVSIYEEMDSPLFDMLGFDPQSFEEIDFEQVERDRQLLVVECMEDLGFEYQVRNFDLDISSGVPGIDPDIEWGTRKFAETYGYGISTFIADEISSFGAAPSQEELPEDPNEAYLAFLSDGERDAWQSALYGQEPEIWNVTDDEGNPVDPETGELYTDDEIQAAFEGFDGGCANAGYDDGNILGEEQARLTAFYEQFDDLLQDMNDRIENDPRMTELMDGWVRCMADKSYTFMDPSEPFSSVSERMTPIYDQLYRGPDEERLDPEVAANMTDEEIEEFSADFAPQAPEITPELQAQIDAVNAYEIGVAVADHDCTKPLTAGLFEVQRDGEEQFIEDNQGAITAFLEENQG